MKGRDLKWFFVILIIAIIIGYFIFRCEHQSFEGYSDIVTFLSIVIGFEITSLSILFNSPLKKTLFDRNNNLYTTELHRLKRFYSFSIYVSLGYILLIILLPEFTISICDILYIRKSIIVTPILCTSAYCFVRLCQELFDIFVYPTNESSK